MAENIVEQIERLISALGLKNQRHLSAVLGISPARITDAKIRGAIPSEWLVKAAENGINPAWVKTGTGPMKIGGAATGTGIDAPSMSSKAAEAMAISKYVMESETNYANALWHNLVSFKDAVEKEKERAEMKEMMEKLAEDNRILMEKMERMEQAIVSPGAETKKRDKAANS